MELIINDGLSFNLKFANQSYNLNANSYSFAATIEHDNFEELVSLLKDIQINNLKIRNNSEILFETSAYPYLFNITQQFSGVNTLNQNIVLTFSNTANQDNN